MALTRKAATEANKVKIAQAVLANKKFSSALSANRKLELTAQANKQTNVIQSKLGTSGISQKVIDEQKKLAEKFGIVTFDTLGNISNVPTTREIDDSINVGTGRFTSAAFATSVKTLQEKLTPNQSQGSIGEFFQNNIANPINQFIDEIFTSVDKNDLPQEQQDRINVIDLEIEELRKRIRQLQAKHKADLPRLMQRGNELGQAYTKLYKDTDAINAKIKILQNEKTQILKKFATETTLTDEIKKLTFEMSQLLASPEITLQIKQDAADLVSKGSAVIEKMLKDGIDVQKDIVSDLQRAILGLVQLQKENITQKQTELNIDLGFINDGLFGIATVLSETFEKLFNPEVSELTDTLIKYGIAQRQAAKELAKL